MNNVDAITYATPDRHSDNMIYSKLMIAKSTERAALAIKLQRYRSGTQSARAERDKIMSSCLMTHTSLT